MKKKLIIFSGLLAAIGGGLSWRYYHSVAPHPQAFIGYGEGSYIYVAPSLAGQLIALKAKRGDRLKVSQPIIVLEQENEKAMLKEAQERLEKSKQQYNNLLTGRRPQEMAVTQAQMRQAEADLSLYKVTVDRQKLLVKTQAASQDALDRAIAQYNRGIARIEELKAQLVVDTLPARPYEVAAAKKDVDASQAILKQAQWKVDQKNIATPVDALVIDVLYRAGEWVNAGAPILTLLPDSNRFVRFFVPESALKDIRMGQHVHIYYTGRETPIEGKIRFISPVAEYNPPVLYNRESRSRLVFMVEAAPLHPSEDIHPGQPVDVEVLKE